MAQYVPEKLEEGFGDVLGMIIRGTTLIKVKRMMRRLGPLGIVLMVVVLGKR